MAFALGADADAGTCAGLFREGYVLVPSPPRDEPCEVIGYYTLVPHMYRDGETDEVTAKALKVKKLGAIPTLLLGQLGLPLSIREKGLVRTCYATRCVERFTWALSAGGVAVVTDPINETAAKFYKDRGFRPLSGQEPRLIIPTRALAKYNPNIVAAFKGQTQAVEGNFGTQIFQA